MARPETVMAGGQRAVGRAEVAEQAMPSSIPIRPSSSTARTLRELARATQQLAGRGRRRRRW